MNNANPNTPPSAFLLTWLALFLLITGLAGCLSRPLPQAAVSPIPLATTTGPPATLIPINPRTTPTPVVITATAPPTAALTATIVPATIPAPSATSPWLLTYIVQAGDTLESIAQKHGLSATALANANFLADPHQLAVGRSLIIPLYFHSPPAVVTVPTPSNSNGRPLTLGYSLLERPIELYTFGQGHNELIFVGGIHGGYEWNSTVLAYQAIDYFIAHPERIPPAVTLHIIPAANPDGLYAVTGKLGPIRAPDILAGETFPARFNAHGVDLNRNWDCNWSAEALWRNQLVSGGRSPFSEVENQLLRAFFQQRQAALRAVVFWHSQAALVSPGQCESPHPPSIESATVYASAAGYPVAPFSSYEVTGDASDWLAQQGIAAFSVELLTHQATDWTRNRAGMLALLAWAGQ